MSAYKFALQMAGFTSILSLSGMAYMHYSIYQQHNESVNRLKNNNELQKYLFETNEQQSYLIDEIMDRFEMSFNSSHMRKYKQTLLALAQGKVLQICAGSNRNLQFYPFSIDLTLIDYSPKMVAVGTIKNSPIIIPKYIVGDVRNMPFEDNTFDTVVDIFGLESVLNPHQALSEIRRVCKKNGTVLLMNLGLSSTVQFHYYQNFVHGEKLLNTGIFTNRNWEKLIREFDFEVKHLERKKNGKIYIHVLKNTKTGNHEGQSDPPERTQSTATTKG